MLIPMGGETVIHQLWGPFVDLVGGGGYRALTFGSWFVMKYANVLVFVVVAVLFTVSMFLHLPEHGGDSE